MFAESEQLFGRNFLTHDGKENWPTLVARIEGSSPDRVILLRPKPYNNLSKAMSRICESQSLLGVSSEALDDLFTRTAKENKFPGCAYGITYKRRIIYSGSKGFAQLSTERPATTKTLFRIASMSKSFVAMTILKLRDGGSLTLDELAENYLPELASITYPTNATCRITVAMLLNMTCGLPEDNAWADRLLETQNDELLAFILRGISFSTVPGHKVEYSNLAYAMLGQIINNITCVPYQLYIQRAIFDTLGMNNTVWEFTDAPSDGLAQGYHRDGDQWVQEPMLHDGAYGAIGGIITSIEDYALYLDFLQSAWPPKPQECSGPISLNSVREMTQRRLPWKCTNLPSVERDNRPAIMSYGLGLIITEPEKGPRFIGHPGGLPGFGSSFRYYPEQGLGLMLFANCRDASAAASECLQQVADTLFASPGFCKSLEQGSQILSQRWEQVAELVQTWDRSLAAKILADNVFEDEPYELRREQAASVMLGIGQVVELGPLVPEGWLRARFTIIGNKGSAEVFFALTPERTPKVQRLSLALK